MKNINKNIIIQIIENFLLNFYLQKDIIKNKDKEEFIFITKEDFILSFFFNYFNFEISENKEEKDNLKKYKKEFFNILFDKNISIEKDILIEKYINTTSKKNIKIIEALKLIEKRKINFSDAFVASIYFYNKYYSENKIQQNIKDYFFIILAITFEKEIFEDLIIKMFNINENLIKFINKEIFNNNSLLTKENTNLIMDMFINELTQYVFLFKYSNKEDTKLFEKKDNFIKKLSVDKKLVFRSKEVEKILFNLFKMNNSNVLVTGKKGVGKTSLIKSIFTYKDKYPLLKNIEMYQLNINSTISKETIKITLKTITKQQKDTIILINFDEKYNFDLLKSKNPFDNNFYNELNFIYEISNFINKSPNLKLIFDINFKDKITIDNNNNNLTIIELKLPKKKIIKDIIKKEKEVLETFYNTKLSDTELDYLVNKNFQDFNSIINYLDEQLAKKQFLNNSFLFDIHNLKSSNLNELKEKINKKLFGQDKNIEKLINKFEIYKAGLNNNNKPIASFMFSGNSGTGKTELARLLADYLNVKLLRYDMSEFQESHSISKFLGSPAGYIGYEDGSLLIKDLEENPNSILLLDEIEKADSAVIKMFLQVLEEGSIKGSNGKSISLNNNIIIFTTNAGAKSYIEKSTGFISTSVKSKSNDTLKTVFPIEFLNRLDDIFYFENLDKKTLEKIVYKELYNMLSILNKNIKINVSKIALNKLIEEGYDEDYGARNIKRIIDKNIKLLIAKKINNENLTDNIKNIDVININYIKNEYSINFHFLKKLSSF